MRIFLKQAEISAAIALYIASKGLVMASDTELDITFSITRNPTSVTAEFEVPDLVPVALSLEEVIKTEKVEVNLSAGQVNEPLTGELMPAGAPLNQAEPETQAQQDALLDAHQSADAGGTVAVSLGQAIGETSVVKAADPVADLNQALEVANALAEDDAADQAAAEAPVAEAQPAVEAEAPVADTKSLFG